MGLIRIEEIIDELPKTIRKQVIDWMGKTFLRIENQYEEKIKEIATRRGHELPQEEDYREARRYWNQIKERNLKSMRDKIREVVQEYRPLKAEEGRAVSRSGSEYRKRFSYEPFLTYQRALETTLAKMDLEKTVIVYLPSREYGKEELPSSLCKYKVEIAEEGKLENPHARKEESYALV